MSHLRHLFVPHHTNNQRAKIIHPSSLSLIIGVFAIFQIVISQLSIKFPSILGYASQIPVSEILSQTNQERLSHGLNTLVLNQQLSQAAANKASDMFANNYWAHVSPSGTQPWFFISESGYSYRFAGENLARDFSDPTSVVQAWMNSPTHRDNVLNSRYQDIGVAVVDGVLEGRETTLVVQMFGTKLSSTPAISGSSTSITVKAKEPDSLAAAPIPTQTISPTPLPTPVAQLPDASSSLATTQDQISPYDLTKNISLGLLFVLSLVLIIDIVVVARKKVVRWTSKSLAHLIFILILTIAAGTILRGQIL